MIPSYSENSTGPGKMESVPGAPSPRPGGQPREASALPTGSRSELPAKAEDRATGEDRSGRESPLLASMERTTAPSSPGAGEVLPPAEGGSP